MITLNFSDEFFIWDENDGFNCLLINLFGFQEVILLTTELIAANTEKTATTVSYEGSSKESTSQRHRWKTGDICLAPWSEDGQ